MPTLTFKRGDRVVLTSAAVRYYGGAPGWTPQMQGCGNRRARGREALTRRETWGSAARYSPMASSTVRPRIHARCASHVASVMAPADLRLAR